MTPVRAAWDRAWAGSQDRWADVQVTSPFLGRLVRAYRHAQERHEAELAASLTVRALLALVPAVACVLAVLTWVLHDPADQTRLAGVLLDAFLPGLAGPVLPDKPLALAGGTAALVALAAVLGLGVGWVRALRRGIASMWDAPLGPTNVFVEKVADLLTLLCLGAVLAVAGAVSFGGRLVIHAAMDSWAGAGVGTAMTVGTQLVGVLGLWVGLVVVAARVLPATLRSLRGLAHLATAAVVCLTVLKVAFVLYADLVGARNGSLYGAFAAVAGVLLWLSLTSRALLLSAAWAAVDVHARGPVSAPGSMQLEAFR